MFININIGRCICMYMYILQMHIANAREHILNAISLILVAINILINVII